MDQVLYHYCSTQTGFAILQSRTFRLSPLSAANDVLEGRVLSRLFALLLRETGLPQGVVDVASVIVEGYADSTEGFAFCLSENGDLLSQWRAYASDGTGISIGFSSDFLIRDYDPVNFGKAFYELLKVNYGEAELRDRLVPIARQVEDEFSSYGEFVSLKGGLTRQDALRALADREAETHGLFVARNESSPALLSQLMKTLAPLHFRIYGTKPKTFQEECEWRLLRYRHRASLPEIEYFAGEDSVRPFIPCLIADPAREAIREIVLGPKHRTDRRLMRSFLQRVGLGHVKVLSSEHESYR
ncbi:MAG: hypothetical protein B7Y95_00645 [Rhizobiales bacterium 32-66-11]|nr:MAG: hypothetical protein B7Z45_03290 [Azorhizobium sp. 12-66-6]OYX75790.1 MAG: hypothetical protein B7Y95_00645 [Rhizobiales bacterium 32-66-11]